jgi:UDP:flavonoid glycosyltransferase YjiC (YdhE family)
MRILCAALSGAGFLLPTVAIARELARRGHDVRFVADVSCAARLAECGLTRIPRTERDGPSFRVAEWFDPLHVAMQFAHLGYAAETFVPDVVLASHLALGPAAFCAQRRIPLVVIGPIVYLWPLRDDAPYPDADGARAAASLWDELRAIYFSACRELQLATSDAAILGERYLLQGVPALDPGVVAHLPAHVRQIGSCLFEPPGPDTRDVEAWIATQRALGRPVVFVQLGRMFGAADPWPALAAWAAADGCALVASLERYDVALEPARGNVLVQNGVPLQRIVPLADFVICSGTASPLLAAAAAGKPALVAYAGSGTHEHAAAFERYGSGLSFDAANFDAQYIATLVRRLRREPEFSRRARALQAAFEELGGSSLAADHVESAARVAA